MGVPKDTVSNGAAALSNVLIESSKVRRAVTCVLKHARCAPARFARLTPMCVPAQNRLAKDKFLLSVADLTMPDSHKTALAEVRGSCSMIDF